MLLLIEDTEHAALLAQCLSLDATTGEDSVLAAMAAAAALLGGDALATALSDVLALELPETETLLLLLVF